MKIRPGMYVQYGNYKCKVHKVYSDYLELIIQDNPMKIISVPFDKINYVVESHSPSKSKGCKMMYD